MRMSDERMDALYRAIERPVSDLRIALVHGNVSELDAALYDMQIEIWLEVFKVLRLEGTP